MHVFCLLMYMCTKCVSSACEVREGIGSGTGVVVSTYVGPGTLTQVLCKNKCS